MEKRKNDQNEWRQLISDIAHVALWIIGIIVVSVVLLACAGVVFFLSAFGQGCWGISHCTVTSISVVSSATATPLPRQPDESISYTQTLLDHPLIPPEFLHLVPSIPYDGETATVCVLVDTAHLKTGTQSFSIDWVTVKDKEITVGAQAEPMREICAHVRVRPGLYLMRFTALYVIDGDLDFMTYRWAVEIK